MRPRFPGLILRDAVRSGLRTAPQDEAMPELPEVETVRRGLAPVMQGERFPRSHCNRADLRWPFPKDFAKRLTGQTITHLGRRAKYLLAELSSGDVLVMHLGMSGSFRVFAARSEDRPGRLLPRALAAHRSRPCGVRVLERRRHHLQRSTPLRLYEAGAAGELDDQPFMRALGPEPLGNSFNAAALAQACARQEDQPQGGLARPAQ